MYLFAIFAFFFGIGIWLFIRKRKEENGERSEKALFKGIKYLISNERDLAIEEFVKSVKLNSETVETYIALADLYRSKGEIGRAIRIRQNIIMRPNLDEKTKLSALFDLGLDYRKAGLLDRALYFFQKVIQKDPKNIKALKEIEKIYEDTKEWDKAYEIRKKIEKIEKADHRNILAHYLTEMAKEEEKNGNTKKAISLLKKAISTYKGCIDAYLHLGDIYFGLREYKKALNFWKDALDTSSRFAFLVYRRLEKMFSIEDSLPIEEILKECAEKNPDVFICMAYAKYLYAKGDTDGALSWTEKAIKIDPLFWEARRFKGKILLENKREKEALEEFKDILENIPDSYLRFQCKRCGFVSSELQWKCPQCRNWDTMMPSEER